MDTADHVATMAKAARDSDCGVPWQLLAAIARVESDFGRNMNTSSAGAIGYGQFLPGSWAAFGSDGNAYDYRDALPAIALYLCKAGLERDPRSALFAYNHADWYVDLVLNLAVRYDRMAPGAPTPQVLDVGPDQQPPVSIHYAAGRDLRLAGKSRANDSNARWLGVPWQGRTPGQPIAAESLQTTTLTMLRLAYGIRGDVPAVQGLATSQDLAPLADTAWSAGLLALPGEAEQWTAAELRRHVLQGQPVVVFVGKRSLPGHPLDDGDGEQPLLLIGTTASGFIYADPSFSSSLGYGLELSETDLAKVWDAAARPRQALAFAAQRAVMSTHIAQAVAPVPITRVELPALPTPVPTPVPVPTVEVAVATPVPAIVPTRAVEATPPPAVIEGENAAGGASEWGVAWWGVGVVAVGGAAAGVALKRPRRGRWF